MIAAPPNSLINRTRLPGRSEALIRLFYPETCGFCSDLLPLEESVLCRKCTGLLYELRFSPLDSIQEDPFEHLNEVWTLFSYDSPLRELLVKIKFSRRRRLLRIFEHAIQDYARIALSASTYNAIIPIPLDWQRQIEREFNQAELIGKMISKWTGIPIVANMLRKICATKRQSELSREERKVNLRGTFKAVPQQSLKGQSFLLVDDIMTTGATGEEAARTLKELGAKRVDLLALARTEMETT